MNVLEKNINYAKSVNADLDTMLEEITVMEADEVPNNPKNLSGWFAVVDTTGINGYFSTDKEAYAYRLFLINRVLNN